MWATLIVAWLGVNVWLVFMLWQASERKSRREKDRAARLAEAEVDVGHGPLAEPRQEIGPLSVGDARQFGSAAQAGVQPADREMRRVVMLVGGQAAHEHRLADAADICHCDGVCRPANANAGACRSRELQAEIRALRLTVAELSLERARLSSAMARRKG